MITIDLGTIEHFDDDSKQFSYEEIGVVRFEYTLKGIYNWEGRWGKPFLGHDLKDLTDEEMIDFYKEMALDPIKEEHITEEVMEILSNYIISPITATKFSEPKKGQNGNKSANKILTSEEIYALMTLSNIPLDFENRDFNRLMVIFRIISHYKNPPEKMSTTDIYRQNSELNAARKKQMKTRG